MLDETHIDMLRTDAALETAWQEIERLRKERNEWRSRAERIAQERQEANEDAHFFDLAYQDLMERLCTAFDCPNPNAIVEHIQALFEAERAELAVAQADAAALRKALWIPQDEKGTLYCCLCNNRYPEHYETCIAFLPHPGVGMRRAKNS